MKLSHFLAFAFATFCSGAIGQKQQDISHLFKSLEKTDAAFVSTNFMCDAPLAGGVSYTALLDVSNGFSCFGVGFYTPFELPAFGSLAVRWRSYDVAGWTDWQHALTEFTPDEVASKMHRTNALFTWDATVHTKIEIEFTFPVGMQMIEVNLFDGTTEPMVAPSVLPRQQNECLPFPSYVSRAEWCGGSASCGAVLSPYNVTYTTPTHTLIHHGASPQSYVNGASVVQSYWNYHVNTLGWVDIGYNYLVDHQGNIYQGRHNPSLPSLDVWGAHAGASNSGSVGICFLGDLDALPATIVQLNALTSFLGWWYDDRGFNPLSSASLVTQSYGTQVLPRISAHRDVTPTACPSDNLYAQLSAIRASVAGVISNAEEGCTDELACNYSLTAGCDDGSCIYSEDPIYDCEGNCLNDSNGDGICDENDTCANSCGIGTVWDDGTSTCVVENAASYCGAGTVWSEIENQCLPVVNNCPSDVNTDGLVTVADVLQVMADFGTSCE